MDEVPVGALFPVAVRCRFVPGGDAVVALKAPEMVDAHHVVNGGGVLHALLPPCKAGGLVNGPVVQRVAPQLSVCRKGVRRASGHLRQVHGAVGLEQLRVGPQVAGIRADIDGDIAHQPDALRVCVGLEGAPLGVEEKLHSLVVVDTPGKLCLGCGNGFRLTAAQRVRPVGKARLPLRGLHCHEQGIILQPEAVFAAEGFISGGRGGQQTIRCFFQDNGPLVVERTVIDGSDGPFRRNLVSGQPAVRSQQAVINEIRVAGKGRKALVGAVAVAGGADGQDLPEGLLRLGQKIHECKGLFSQRTDAKGARQAENRHQNAACTHCAHLLSP